MAWKTSMPAGPARVPFELQAPSAQMYSTFVQPGFVPGPTPRATAYHSGGLRFP